MRDNEPLAQASNRDAARGGKVASLGPVLLARKGAAKPAMRAQLGSDARGSVAPATTMTNAIEELAACQEALGWNDMGEAHDEAQVYTLAEYPEVRRRQHELVQRIADANQLALERGRTSDREGQPATERRVAFTLRLDEGRHLRLRLASTVHGESAQALLTRALDAMLAEMPEIAQLADQISGGAGKA